MANTKLEVIDRETDKVVRLFEGIDVNTALSLKARQKKLWPGKYYFRIIGPGVAEYDMTD